MSMDAFKVAMYVYNSYKFGVLLSGTSSVNVAQLYTAGSTRFNSSMFTTWQHVYNSILLASG